MPGRTTHNKYTVVPFLLTIPWSAQTALRRWNYCHVYIDDYLYSNRYRMDVYMCVNACVLVFATHRNTLKQLRHNQVSAQHNTTLNYCTQNTHTQTQNSELLRTHTQTHTYTHTTLNTHTDTHTTRNYSEHTHTDTNTQL